MVPGEDGPLAAVNKELRPAGSSGRSGNLPNLPMASPSLGSVSQSRFSENPGFINPEMRETLGFPFHKGR